MGTSAACAFLLSVHSYKKLENAMLLCGVQIEQKELSQTQLKQ